jgi:hypothetical protein
MGEARDVGEAVRSIRSALYDLRRRPEWTGGATRAEIVNYCLTQKLSTPERFFGSAIHQLDVDKMATTGDDPALPELRYALTREGQREEERERRHRGAPVVDELPAPQPEERESHEPPGSWPLVLPAPQLVPDRDALPLPSPIRDLSTTPFGGEALRLLVSFGLGLLTGVLLSNRF